MQKVKSREILPLNQECFDKIDTFAESGDCSSFMNKRKAIPYTKFFVPVLVRRYQKREVYGTRFVV